MTDYAVVALLAAAIGAVELVARYRDAPADALRRQPAVLYVALHAAAGMIGLTSSTRSAGLSELRPTPSA